MNIFIAKNKTQMGPYSPEQVISMLNSGLLEKHDLYWHEGMLDWAPVAALKQSAPIPAPSAFQVSQPRYPQTPPQQQYPSQINPNRSPTQQKSRVAYIVLGFFLGGLGIHNFYAGYTGKGLAQLLLTIFSAALAFIPLIVVGVWVLAEICTVTKDAQGVPFE